MPNFYDDIYKYLEGVQNSKSVSTSGLEEMVLKVRAKTGLPKDVCNEIVRQFFQEMRNAMLRGEAVTLNNIGKLLVKSPKNGNVKRVFSKFEPSKDLLGKINGR